jgi:hypothetical protein
VSGRSGRGRSAAQCAASERGSLSGISRQAQCGLNSAVFVACSPAFAGQRWRHRLIEPWWKTLRSLALQGRRFETWTDVEQAITAATAYGNAHRHPYTWGRRRRHRPTRRAALALTPKSRELTGCATKELR